MDKKENISRRDALKRMSKTAMAVTLASMLPSVNALANDLNSHSDYSEYSNYNDYSDARYPDFYYGDSLVSRKNWDG